VKNLEWFVVRHYLGSRRRGRFLSLITLIAVGGIVVGVMALITVIAVMTGLQRDLQAKILGTNPHVYVFENGAGFRLGNWQHVLTEARAQPNVVAATPYVMAQVAVTESTDALRPGLYMQPGVLYGIDPGISDIPLNEIERDIQAGRYAFGPTLSGHPGVLVGRRLGNRLGLMPGDRVTIGAFENIRVGPTGDLVPSLMEMEVTGLFETGMYEYDSSYMYAPMSAVQELLDLPTDTVSGIAVNLVDPWLARDVSAALSERLGYPYWTSEWMTLNAPLFGALQLEKTAMGVILFLIVVVAAFNIISTLIMVVSDKTREIGILKSMGMTDRSVLRIFMLQGLTIGLIGTALGLAGGLALVWALDTYRFIELPAEVYFLDTLPVALEIGDVLLIMLASIFISFVATIYPARQASRLQPVDAIRHE
jgi:lipoprotein-releasing system permease protein